MASRLDPRVAQRGLRKLSQFLHSTEAGLCLFHRSVADWLSDPQSSAEYVAHPASGHKRLADACWQEYQGNVSDASVYTLAHLPAHLVAVESWDSLVDVLCDLRFIESKCIASLTHSLVLDYSTTLNALPELSGVNREESQLQELTFEYGRKMAAYAHECAMGHQIPLPPDTTTILTQRRVDSLHQDCADEAASRGASIGEFASFVSSQSHLLAEFPEETSVIAHDFAEKGLVAECAKSRVALFRRPWMALCRRPVQPPSRRPVIRSLVGHSDVVSCIAITPDARIAVSGGRDHTVRVWDIETGGQLHLFSGHDGPVNAVAISADGNTVVSAGNDHTLRRWDLTVGCETTTLVAHSGPVTAVSIGGDGATAVSASRHGTIRIWDLDSGRQCLTLKGHASSVCSLKLTANGKTLVSAGEDQTLRVWDLPSEEEIHVLRGHTRAVRCVSVTPDGRFAISAGSDNTVRLWSITDGEEVGVLMGHSLSVNSVDMTPDGRIAISASRDGTLRLWDLVSERLVNSYVLERDLTAMSNYGAVAISADGRTAVASQPDGTLCVRDLRSFEDSRATEGHLTSVKCLALAPDGRMVASSAASVSSNVARMYQKAEGLSLDNSIKLWDVEKTKESTALVGHSSSVSVLAFSSDDETVLSASDDHSVRLWDTASGEELCRLTGHSNAVRCLSLSPDGHRAVSGSADGTLRVWNLDSGTELGVLSGHDRPVTDVAVSPDGKCAVSAGEDSTIRLWDLDTFREARMFKGHVAATACIRMAQNGRKVVFAGRDYSLRVWDLDSDRCHGLHGHNDSVRASLLLEDGRTLVSASDDGTVCVWDIQLNENLHVLREHLGPVTCLTSVCSSDLVISGGGDGKLLVWTVRSGKRVAAKSMGKPICCLSNLGHDGRFACGMRDGRVCFIELHNLP